APRRLSLGLFPSEVPRETKGCTFTLWKRRTRTRAATTTQDSRLIVQWLTSCLAFSRGSRQSEFRRPPLAAGVFGFRCAGYLKTTLESRMLAGGRGSRS